MYVTLSKKIFHGYILKLSFQNFEKNTLGDIGRHSLNFLPRALNDTPFDAELNGLSIAGIAIVLPHIVMPIVTKWREIRILIDHIPVYGANVVHVP